MGETNRKPEIVVFAGPNGSGKTTLSELLRPVGMAYINADEIQRALHCENLEAAQIAEGQREERLAGREDFCFETVLSTDRNLELLKRAKEAGYFIRCYYAITANPLINVARVASRVASGGHDVPRDKIISRYPKALERLPHLIALCDVCHIFDNSTETPFRIFKKRKKRYWYCPRPSVWTGERILALTGAVDAEKAALNR